MNTVMAIHIAGGLAALVAGAVAVAVRKGGSVHEKAGTALCVAMFVLGLTASLLSPLKTPPESPVGGIMVCYFVATAWMAARRRDGAANGIDKVACAFILLTGAAIVMRAYEVSQLPPGTRIAPPGAGGLVVFGLLCLAAGAGDIRFILRRTLSRVQRLTRHLWRMCFAFFIATGSFFLGQQDVLPQAMRGTAIQWMLAFAPFAVMLFWLVRVRYGTIGRVRAPAPVPAER
jgi:uncharacterized membrane protein